MTRWKLPPKEKIYEAFSVIADERFEIKADGKASITSSAGDKHYSVTWSVENDEHKISISSNDNASRWQGYTGYPIIALLMVINKINYNKTIIEYFKGIPWNKMNKAYKNNYSLVVEIILNKIENKSDVESIRNEVNNIYKQIGELHLVKPG